MDSTDGLVRGQTVTDTGGPITVPVGPETLGRILNVIGDPVDERGPVVAKRSAPIHRPAPDYVDQATETEMLVTGIKVVDLLAPSAKGELGRAECRESGCQSVSISVGHR